jgi:hypothetical protein
MQRSRGARKKKGERRFWLLAFCCRQNQDDNIATSFERVDPSIISPKPGFVNPQSEIKVSPPCKIPTRRKADPEGPNPTPPSHPIRNKKGRILKYFNLSLSLS